MKPLLRAFAALILTSLPAAAEIGDDGMHKQPFFTETFLDMNEDLAEATAMGKDLLVIIEQRGCPYCTEMHEVNFARDDVVRAIEENYFVVQLNMWGSREVTDFDGEVLEERDVISRWGASFTPTSLFFTMEDPDSPPSSMRDALAFMLPGYFKPFHHLTALEYVASDGYIEQPNFQRWLQTRAEDMQSQGLEVDVWGD